MAQSDSHSSGEPVRDTSLIVVLKVSNSSLSHHVPHWEGGRKGGREGGREGGGRERGEGGR